MSNLPELRSVELCPEDSVLGLDDLWLRCFALGTMNTPAQLGGFLRGELRPSRHEYNVVAVAMNEYLSDIGAPQSVPYIEQLELPDHPALPQIASLGRPRSPTYQATGETTRHGQITRHRQIKPTGPARPGSVCRAHAGAGQADGGPYRSDGGATIPSSASANDVHASGRPPA